MLKDGAEALAHTLPTGASVVMIVPISKPMARELAGKNHALQLKEDNRL